MRYRQIALLVLLVGGCSASVYRKMIEVGNYEAKASVVGPFLELIGVADASLQSEPRSSFKAGQITNTADTLSQFVPRKHYLPTVRDSVAFALIVNEFNTGRIAEFDTRLHKYFYIQSGRCSKVLQENFKRKRHISVLPDHWSTEYLRFSSWPNPRSLTTHQGVAGCIGGVFSGFGRDTQFRQLVAYYRPLALRILRVDDARRSYGNGQEEHSNLRDGNFQEPFLESVPVGYGMQGCGILTLLCAFGAGVVGLYGLSRLDWKFAISGVIFSALFLWLSIFLIHRGLDLTDRVSDSAGPRASYAAFPDIFNTWLGSGTETHSSVGLVV